MEQQPKQQIDAQASIEQCYFIMYMSNPTKDSVRAVVDGGDVKFTMKRQRFYNLCKKLCGDSIEGPLYQSCQDYGEFYILDREAKTVKHLRPTFKNEKLNPSKVHKDVMNERHKDGFYDMASQYWEFMQDGLEKQKDLQDKSGIGVTESSGFIDYTNRKK